jgi:hypothetical protein
LKERGKLKDLAVDEAAIKMILKIGWNGMAWIYLAQDRGWFLLMRQ